MHSTQNKIGRPPVEDLRKPLPFRLRASIIAMAVRIGRDRVEFIINQEHQKQLDKIIRAEQFAK